MNIWRCGIVFRAYVNIELPQKQKVHVCQEHNRRQWNETERKKATEEEININKMGMEMGNIYKITE